MSTPMNFSLLLGREKLIPQKNISALSNRLFATAGGRRIPDDVLERDYCIAWILVGIARSELPKWLAFKGGTALKRCYFPDYRFSEDLDFTLLEGANVDQILEEFQTAFKQTFDASGIIAKLSTTQASQGRNSHTFYIGYEGPLPTARPKEIKCDMTLSEAIEFPLENLPVLQAYQEFTDLAEVPDNVTVYSLNEIAAEKTLAVLDIARTEPRDLYDLSFLTSEGIELADLEHAVREKLRFRSNTLEQVAGNFLRKEGRYRTAWQQRLGNQMANLPHFEDTYRAVQRSLRQAGFLPS